MPCKAYNEIGFPVLNQDYLKKAMGQSVKSIDLDPWDKDMIEAELKKFGFDSKIKETGNEMSEDFDLPDLLADNISGHFDAMAKDLSGRYFRIIRSILRYSDLSELPDVKTMTLSHLVKPNVWTKITKSGVEYVTVPDSDWLVLDYETFVKGSKHDSPIIGTAIGQDSSKEMAYYLWCHESLLDNTILYNPHLSNIGENKVVIIHNAAFDAALFYERYTLDSLNNFYMCTLAMNRVVSGLDSSQEWAVNLPEDAIKPKFMKYGCSSSLVNAYQFHTGKKLDKNLKQSRNIFVEANHISEITECLEESLQYAVNDVRLTLELFLVLYPKYRNHLPSDVAVLGASLLIGSIVPLRDDWHEWLEGCENIFNSYQSQIKQLINSLADKYHTEWSEGRLDAEKDIWLRHLDWTQSSLFDDRRVAKWYEDKIVYGEPLDISAKTVTSHYLLKLQWNGYPLQKSKEDGWHYVDENGKLLKVPHPDGSDANVGTLLNSKFESSFESGILSSADDEIGRQICHLIEQCSFYLIMRERLLSIYTHPIENPVDGSRVLLAAPRVNPSYTISGRVVDPIFVVLASHVKSKIAGEIKSMVYSPKGYRLVSADSDGQEATIAAIYGSSYNGISGSSPLHATILTGDKKYGTDFHSLNAKAANISRDCAKQCG